ncbi:hypothetical protein U1Q18_045144 [Sarracenia purpurea var. burkii]
MSTKVDQASIEPRHVQIPVATNASSVSTNNPKISLFGSKSGFVIPKNKLSGSLVPIYRGGKKAGGSVVANEESTKQVQRKTKWGPDPSLDAAVRKGRALAYQTRVEQITKQLNSGCLEMGDNQDSALAAQIPDHESSIHQIKNEKLELLELEKREAIGEILKLNPSYRAPPDYKPLLKEAKVPVPIKEYPVGYNFIGLIFGPASDTQKRLEKETGAKIRVYGTKADTGEKGEIAQTDGNEAHGAYEDLYVQISADTYEKVDAAVDLIELLVTPVSVNPSSVSTTPASISADNVNVADLSQGTSAPCTVPPVGVNMEVAQPITGSTQTPPQGQFQPYQGSWFSAGPPQNPIRPPSGFIFTPNPSASVLRNPFQPYNLPFNPSNMPSLFGPRPGLATSTSSAPFNYSLLPSRLPPPVLQHPLMPQSLPFDHIGTPKNPPMVAFQSSPTQPRISGPPPFTHNQPSSTGPPSVVNPYQPLSRPTSGPFPDQVLSSTQWSQPLAGTHPATSQPIIVSGASLPNISAVNMASHLTFPSRPSVPNPSSSAAGNHPIAAAAFTSSPLLQAGVIPPTSSFVPTQVPPPRPIQSSSLRTPMQAVMPQSAIPNPPLASTSAPPPPSSQSGIPTSLSGSAPSFTPIKLPSQIAPKPHHPNSGDFTFQPHRPQNVATQAVQRPTSIQPTIQNMLPPNPTAPSPLAPKMAYIWPPFHTSSPQPVMRGIPRSQLSNQMNQPQTQLSPFVGNPTVTVAPLRHPAVPNPNPAAPASPVPLMGPRNLNPPPQTANLSRPFPPRPGNPLQVQPSYPASVGRPQRLLSPHQQLGSNPSLASVRPASGASGVQQIYDPFSPTSASTLPIQGGNPAKLRNQESDPEYEDLMASVGVK